VVRRERENRRTKQREPERQMEERETNKRRHTDSDSLSLSLFLFFFLVVPRAREPHLHSRKLERLLKLPYPWHQTWNRLLSGVFTSTHDAEVSNCDFSCDFCQLYIHFIMSNHMFTSYCRVAWERLWRKTM